MYEKALRGSLKDTVENMRREQQQPYVIVTPEERNRNKLIEREHKEHAKALRGECKVLLLGDRHCMQTFIKATKATHSNGFTYEEREKYQKAVMKTIMYVMEGMASILENEDIDLDGTAKMHAKVLTQEVEKIKASNGKITVDGADAVRGLWENEQLVKKFLDEVDIPDSST